ncbi:MAG: outer membrane beta-barrel protein [Oleiphilaceae bacterium]|nr:outer membrane beta-barrel protein [Oleiphilaceae bacterium]
MSNHHCLATALTLALGMMTVSAGAMADGPYIGVRGGPSQLRDMSYNTNTGRVDTRYDSGRSFSVMAGAASFYENGFRARVELEAGRQSGEVSGSGRSGDTRAAFGLINVYGDRQIGDGVDFVFGGGVGLGDVEFDDHRSGLLAPRLDDRDRSVGYQANAGLAFALSERVSLELGYRFQSWENLEVTTRDGRPNELSVSSHNLLLGLRLGI